MPYRQRNTLVADIINELRQMILTGKIQPGEFLPPRKDLASQFGVGLSTVQEAIQALTALGLLESRPGKGTWVRDDALDTLIHPTMVKARLGELNAQQVQRTAGAVLSPGAQIALRSYHRDGQAAKGEGGIYPLSESDR